VGIEVWGVGDGECGGWNNLPYEFPGADDRSSSVSKM
jgi:hypothetical protein